MSSASAGYPRRFGRYVLMAPVGLGEMATVTLALMGKRGQEQLCVIKRARPEVLADPTARDRIQRETEIARSLSHAGIARTFADGIEDGTPYLVEEFVHGWTLSRLLTSCAELQRWPSVPLACHIVREVARSLAYVHSVDGAGIVHRDIAPPNIILSFAGEVKLIDFGIAKRSADAKKSDPATIVGRYTYGAPEIFTGRDDARSDLYGLAVVLWMLLAHRSDPNPFLRDRRAPVPDDQATIEAPPAPSNFNELVPPELDAIVLRALSFLPEDRFQTANEVARALAGFLPSAFNGSEQLATFFRQHTVPEEASAVTADMLRRAVGLLEDDDPRPAAAVTPPTVEDAATAIASGRHPSRRWTILLVGSLAGGFAGLIAAMTHHSERAPVEPRAVLPSTVLRDRHVAPPALPLPSASFPIATTPASSQTTDGGRVVRSPHHPPLRQPMSPAPAAASPGRARVEDSAPVPFPDPAARLAEARDSFEAEDFPKALRLARQAQREGAGVGAWVLIGRILMVEGDISGAEAAASAALRLQPDNSQARALLERISEARSRP